MEVGYLWLQDAVTNKRLLVKKVPWKENPADLFTKHLPVADIEGRSKRLSLQKDDPVPSDTRR